MNEHSEDLKEFLEKLELSNAGQEKYARKQYHMAQITAFASILVLCVVLYMAYTIIPKINGLMTQIQASVDNIEEISQELSDADLGGMIEDVDRLVSTSEAGITGAVERLNSIDFDSLNQAIQDLSNIIRPLGKLFGK